MRQEIAALIIVIVGFFFIRAIPLKRSFTNYIVIFMIFFLLEALLFSIESDAVFNGLFRIQCLYFIFSAICYNKKGDFLFLFFENKNQEDIDNEKLNKFIKLFMYIFFSLLYNLIFYHLHAKFFY